MAFYHIEFCEKFSYPDQVRQHFANIAGTLNPEKVLSIILHGSVARGELTWANRNDELILFSDYEFQVVSKGKVDTEDYKRLIEAYKHMEKEISRNSPLFHIDFSYVSLKSLKRLPRSFLTFSKKNYGWILFGEDVRKFIPDVSPKNLDWSEHNKALIWRLFALLIHFTSEMISGNDPSGLQGEIRRYVIAKNSLDLTTWGVPYEGALLPTFKQRVAFIKKNYSSLKFASFMGPDFPCFLEHCLDIKRDPSVEESPLELYLRAIPFFLKAMEFLRSIKSIEPHVASHKDIDSDAFDFYSHFKIKQKGWEFLKLSSSLTNCRSSFKRIFYWFFEPKFQLILASLTAMHLAIFSKLENNTEKAHENLDTARRLINRLSLNYTDSFGDDSFEGTFINLRERLIKAMEDVIPGLVHQRKYIQRALV